MRRLLFLVLLAIAFCSLAEETTKDSDVVLQAADLVEILNKVKNSVRDAIQWLKDVGVYDFLINILKTYGRIAAITACSTKLPAVICTAVIDFLLSLL